MPFSRVADSDGDGIDRIDIGAVEMGQHPCGDPFFLSGTQGDNHPDFYYTPDTGIVVVDTDGVYLESIVLEGPAPLQVSFLPQFWTYAYFTGASQWFLAPGQAPYGGVIATRNILDRAGRRPPRSPVSR